MSLPTDRHEILRVFGRCAPSLRLHMMWCHRMICVCMWFCEREEDLEKCTFLYYYRARIKSFVLPFSRFPAFYICDLALYVVTMAPLSLIYRFTSSCSPATSTVNGHLRVFLSHMKLFKCPVSEYFQDFLSTLV